MKTSLVFKFFPFLLKKHVATLLVLLLTNFSIAQEYLLPVLNPFHHTNMDGSLIQSIDKKGVNPVKYDSILTPFEDYSLCQTGFVHGKDTIYPADYENLTSILIRSLPYLQSSGGYDLYRSSNQPLIPVPSPNSWILSKAGKYGCLLSLTAKWLLPCKYDTLFYAGNYFIASLNGKFGTISDKGAIIIPFEYDKIYSKQFKYSYGLDGYPIIENDILDIQTRGLKGKITNEGKIIVPPLYDSVTELNKQTKNDENFFLVQKGNVQGLISQTGLEILKMQYQKIELLEEHYWYNNDLLFRVVDSLGRDAVFGVNGSQLIPFKTGTLKPVYTFSSIDGKRDVRFVERNDSVKGRQFVHLGSGKESSWYQGINVIGKNEILAYSFSDSIVPADWVVLDSNFREIYAQVNARDQLYGFDYYNQLTPAAKCFRRKSAEIGMPDFDRPIQDLGYKSNVFAIKRTELTIKRKGEKEDEYHAAYSVINGKTGKRTAFAYEDVWRVGNDKTFFYWAVHIGSPIFKSNEYSIDVYDSTLQLLRTICVDKQGWKNRKAYADLRIVQKDGIQSGVLDISGKQKLPYKLSGQVEFLTDKNRTNIYIRQMANNKHYAFDTTGRALLNGQGFDYFAAENELFKSALKNQWSFYSPNLELLLDSCVNPFEISRHDSTGRRIDIQCVERKGFIYGFVYGKAELITPAFFKVQDSVYRLNSMITVDRSGKIIPKSTNVTAASKNKRYGKVYLEKVGANLKIENENHELIQILDSMGIVDYTVHKSNHIQVMSKDRKMGIISDQTGQWLLKPAFQFVATIAPNRYDLFWASDSKINPSKWFIIDSEGKQVTEPIFDEKFTISSERDWNEFKTDYKIGFVNSKFEILTPAVFTNTLYIDKKAVYTTSKEAFLLNYKTGKLFQIKHDIVNEDYPGGHLFIFNDSIQLLDMHGDEVFPATTIKEATSKLNLRKFLYPNETYNVPLPFITNSQIFASDNDSVLFRYNNHLLINRAQRNIISVKKLCSGDRIPKERDTCKIEPTYLQNSYYSEMQIGKCYDQPMVGKEPQKYSYKHYRIEPTGLVPLELKDFFVEGYEPKLDALIQQAIQTNQLYGNSCPDMPRAIADFKRNFFIRDHSLVFFNYALQKHVMVDLSGLLKVKL